MPFLQFALLTLDGAAFSKYMQLRARYEQSMHCVIQCVILNNNCWEI